MANAPTRTDLPSTPPASPEQRGQWWFVHLSIVASFVLFFTFVALLYWNWLRVGEPTAIIHIPRGTEARAGMMIQVEGWNLSEPLQLELTEENNWGGRIYLTPGVYKIKIFRNGELIKVIEDVYTLDYRERTLDLDVEGRLRPKDAP